MPQGWVAIARGVPRQVENSEYTHPLGSMYGRYWMRKGATFSKLKITHHVRRGSNRNVSDFCFIIYNIRFYLFDNYTDEEFF